MQENYLNNFVQSVFDALVEENVPIKVLPCLQLDTLGCITTPP